MKINLPVTGKEQLFAGDKSLVTKTNTKGIITFANQDFVEVSGFSEEELVGKNHNLIRHPDMPPLAFEIMWKTLKRGQPWRGIVKNRCKNGDHYWVDARIVPIKLPLGVRCLFDPWPNRVAVAAEMTGNLIFIVGQPSKECFS